MPTLSRKAALLALASGTVVTLGLVAGQYFAAPASVIESAPRASLSPAPVKVTPDLPPPFAFLESLPEPDGDADHDHGAPPAAVKAEPAPAPVAKAEPMPEPAPEAALRPVASPVAAGETCAIGSRPMGDCNCYDEAKGKVTLTLHPSQACVDEESKRLGHKVILSSAEGHYELAGVEPEHAVAAAAPAAAQALTQAEAQAQLQAAKTAAQPATQAPETVASTEMPKVVMLPPSSIPFMASVPHGDHPPPAMPAPVIKGHPAQSPILMMSACAFRPGHEVHIFGRFGILHIRINTQLSGALKMAHDLVVGGAGSVSIYPTMLVTSSGKVIQLVNQAAQTNYAGTPGFDDSKQAADYDAQLMAQNNPPKGGQPGAPQPPQHNPPSNPVHGPPGRPGSPGTPVVSKPPPGVHPGQPGRPRGGRIIREAKAE